MFESINDEIIARVARDAGAQLAERAYAEVGLAPGDATFYRFIVLPPGRTVCADPSDAGGVERNYLVILATDFGAAYPWTGHAMDGGYCTSKWDRDKRNEHTGEVVARFLTALSKHVEPVT